MVSVDAFSAEVPTQGTGTCPAGVESPVTNQSPSAAKINLFRSLFRGREDVYPLRFESMGYTPMTKSRPKSSLPDRWWRTTSAVTGRKRRFGHSRHFMRGFSHKPRTHSFAHAGW